MASTDAYIGTHAYSAMAADTGPNPGVNAAAVPVATNAGTDANADFCLGRRDDQNCRRGRG
ncbi:hypothetical protein OIHEL45_13760 [Sulfitobacter indolifex HEL-45]|uniref:Uncharacterized protein n=1 Tax=Sulfitobacter indolifex HEL-45 TaxID=391624 RepID=A0ABM9X5K6_9RHOB|nr:hypothetical protein OIHEL45_13760 [Sulfitobacter indolifex HEL-45]